MSTLCYYKILYSSCTLLTSLWLWSCKTGVKGEGWAILAQWVEQIKHVNKTCSHGMHHITSKSHHLRRTDSKFPQSVPGPRRSSSGLYYTINSTKVLYARPSRGSLGLYCARPAMGLLRTLLWGLMKPTLCSSANTRNNAMHILVNSNAINLWHNHGAWNMLKAFNFSY